MGFRSAAIWSVVYVAVALVFGLVLGLLAGWDLGTQFLAGYVVERSLSVDNLFVFVIILSTFAVPAEYQPRALAIGIALALVLRAIFIAVGAALLSAFSFMFLIFGIGLIATAVQLFRHRDEDPSVNDNAVVALARRRLPLTDTYDGNRVLTRSGGRRMLTPLFIVLVAIGTTDFLFALDSIPAVYGVTTHPYIVLAANVFALLGLRPLFFLVSGLLDRLVYLSMGLSVILTFIGIKLVLHFAHLQHHSIPEISTGASLAVIVVVLAVTTIASLARVRRQPRLRAHAGSLRASHADVPATRRLPGADAQTTDTR
jgi:tellurite resistance protein TerC